METTGPMRDDGPARSLFRTTMLALAGPLIWAAHLLVIYGAHAVMCARGVPARASEVVIGAATLVALAALAVLLSRGRRSGAFGPPGQTRSFLWNSMMLLAVLSAFGIVLGGSATLFLPACLALR